MTSPRQQILLSWSSGKDSAWALHVLRQRDDLDVVGLLTTFNETFDRVAMHAVRRELVQAQAAATGLPLVSVMLPYPCSNEIYEDRMKTAIGEAKVSGVTHIAFGDLFLADIREYRIRLLDGTGVEPLFPIWTTANDTPGLARQMLRAGLRAVLTCVDPKQLDARHVGREFDEALLAELPAGVDPCGERGEFHTFCYRSPEFRAEIPIAIGEVVERDGFWFADLRSDVAIMHNNHGNDASGVMNGNVAWSALTSLSSAVRSSHPSRSASTTYKQS
ncbi:MAG: ATP-binding protein [Isosphaeraceae bacterium]